MKYKQRREKLKKIPPYPRARLNFPGLALMMIFGNKIEAKIITSLGVLS